MADIFVFNDPLISIAPVESIVSTVLLALSLIENCETPALSSSSKLTPRTWPELPASDFIVIPSASETIEPIPTFVEPITNSSSTCTYELSEDSVSVSVAVMFDPPAFVKVKLSASSNPLFTNTSPSNLACPSTSTVPSKYESSPLSAKSGVPSPTFKLPAKIVAISVG